MRRVSDIVNGGLQNKDVNDQQESEQNATHEPHVIATTQQVIVK